MVLEPGVSEAAAPTITFWSLRSDLWQIASSTLNLARQLASRPLALLPFGTTSKRTTQLSQESVSLQVSLLSGTDIHLRIVSSSRQGLLEHLLACQSSAVLSRACCISLALVCPCLQSFEPQSCYTAAHGHGFIKAYCLQLLLQAPV